MNDVLSVIMSYGYNPSIPLVCREWNDICIRQSNTIPRFSLDDLLQRRDREMIFRVYIHYYRSIPYRSGMGVSHDISSLMEHRYSQMTDRRQIFTSEDVFFGLAYICMSLIVLSYVCYTHLS